MIARKFLGAGAGIVGFVLATVSAQACSCGWLPFEQSRARSDYIIDVTVVSTRILSKDLMEAKLRVVRRRHGDSPDVLSVRSGMDEAACGIGRRLIRAKAQKRILQCDLKKPKDGPMYVGYCSYRPSQLDKLPDD